VGLATPFSWVSKIYNPNFNERSNVNTMGHAMSIIGIKCKNGTNNSSSSECKYLIRNSWGITSKAQTKIQGVEFENYSTFWAPEEYFRDRVATFISLIFLSDT
jgi:hypothetical protein